MLCKSGSKRSRASFGAAILCHPTASGEYACTWPLAPYNAPADLITLCIVSSSPSPPPTYDAQGRRTNTREVRYRKKLEDERVALVDKQMALDPSFRPPAEYHQTKRSMRPQEKVFLPIKEFPEINFFGLLVGPRGNSLKKMERESGAKISIRGRGSVKEGKGRGGDEDEEEMHCVVTGDDEAKVKKCVRLINLVIETAASTPEGENDHKRNQLRELAALNGTLRDDENQVCQNCGAKGHRKFECPEVSASRSQRHRYL